MIRKPGQLALPLSVDGAKLTGVPKAPVALAPNRQKELGAFYTPPAMAAALADWAVRKSTDRVLDPSFGGLVFLAAARDRLLHLDASPSEIPELLYGVDLDEDAHAASAGTAWLNSKNLLDRDFFLVGNSDLPSFDAVVGNPPYIRYQSFNGSGARARKLATEAGVELTRLASSWAPFVVHGVSFVSHGGRYAQVLPAELLHAQYAHDVVEFLRESFGRIRVAVFDDRVFPGALEEVVLLFAEDRGADGLADVELIACTTVADVQAGLAQPLKSGNAYGQTESGGLLTQLLSARAQDVYGRLVHNEGVHRLGDIASVDIGVVTGANEFFVLSQEKASELPAELLQSAVCKAAQVKGARLLAEDHSESLALGQRGLMFVANKKSPKSKLGRVRTHLAQGEELGFHERYKCRIRDPWWELPIPSAGPPDLLLTYCSSEHPRLAQNVANVLTTNTIHGVRLGAIGDPEALAAGFYNSLTLLSAELMGRSYGGGVLKLEPTEAEALLIPHIPAEVGALLSAVDRAIRNRELEAALDLVDPIVLRPLGLRDADIHELRVGRKRLQTRRQRRGRPAR